MAIWKEKAKERRQVTTSFLSNPAQYQEDGDGTMRKKCLMLLSQFMTKEITLQQFEDKTLAICLELETQGQLREREIEKEPQMYSFYAINNRWVIRLGKEVVVSESKPTEPVLLTGRHYAHVWWQIEIEKYQDRINNIQPKAEVIEKTYIKPEEGIGDADEVLVPKNKRFKSIEDSLIDN